MPLHNRDFDEWSVSPPAGPLFNDYSSVGYSLLIKKNNLINVSNTQAVWRRCIFQGSRHFVLGTLDLPLMPPQFCHWSDVSCLPCQVHGRVVSISGNKTYQCVEMRDFLTELAKKLKKNSTAWDNHQRMYLPQPGPPTSAAGSALRTNVLYKHIEVPLCSLQGCTLACAHTCEQAQHSGLRYTLLYLGELQTRLLKLSE